MSDNKVELTPKQQELRKKAEEILAAAKPAIKEVPGPAVDEILHELHVYQIADADKVILRVNQAFIRITGYSTEDVLGKTPAILCSDRYDEDFHLRL
jgi:PAS domain-containing protein